LATAEQVLARGAETAVNLTIARNMRIPIVQATAPEEVRRALARADELDLLIDAMLGTGAQGQVKEPFLTAIELLNRSRTPVLAVDVPSGLDCDTGRPLGAAVRADVSVTFVCRKAGFNWPGAEQYTGRVQVAEIGIPAAEVRRLLLEGK